MIDSRAILQSRFVDFDATFRAILLIVLPPVDPISPSAEGSQGFLPPALFSLSTDED